MTAVQLDVGRLPVDFVAVLVAALQDAGSDMELVAGSSAEEISYSSNPICGPIGMQSGSSCMSTPAQLVRACVCVAAVSGLSILFNTIAYDMHSSISNLPVLHTTMWQLLLSGQGARHPS